jgi:hypothetical protein
MAVLFRYQKRDGNSDPRTAWFSGRHIALVFLSLVNSVGRSIIIMLGRRIELASTGSGLEIARTGLLRPRECKRRAVRRIVRVK